MRLVLVLFACGACFSPALTGCSAQNQVALNDTDYRFKVEPLIEPVGDTAVCRIQILTVRKRRVTVYYSDGQVGQEGLSLPEEDGKLHKAEFVLFMCLRPSLDGNNVGGKVHFDRWFLVRGGKGRTLASDPIDSKSRLDKLVEFRAAAGTKKLGERQKVGSINDKAVEVEAYE